MNVLSAKKLYPLLIILALIGVAMSQRAGARQQDDAALAALKASPYWEPWAATGVFCQSELDLQHPKVPFNYHLQHPPGDRELVMETVRRLVRTGATPVPWPEPSIQRFRMLRTVCLESWEIAFGKLSHKNRQAANALLEETPHPTEANYREVVLRIIYGKMGTAEAALEWYAPAED